MLRGVVAAWMIGAALALPAGLLNTGAVASPCGYPRPDLSALGGPARHSSNELLLLGRRLFFDTRLSATGGTSCARCHDPRYGYAEPRRVSISDRGEPGRRNSPSLLDVGTRPTLMWDGAFCALEQQALGPFARGEMGHGIDHAMRRLSDDPSYVDLFRVALGDWPSVGGFTRALAEYQRTLFSAESRVDRFVLVNDPSVLTPLEHHGYQVFTRRAPCSNCHQLFPLLADGRPSRRPLFTDFRFHNLGVSYRWGGAADPGRFGVSRITVEWGTFRTPSLRNVARTAPYMHDGSLDTLEGVVEFYDAGGVPNPHLSSLIRPLGLNGHEKAALVAFLRALSDQP
jgi:cytochrome c peroxidase